VKTFIRYIVIRNGVETRIVSNQPRLEPNEIAFKLVLKVPQPPRIVGEIEITLPENPTIDPAMVTLAEWITWQEEESDDTQAPG